MFWQVLILDVGAQFCWILYAVIQFSKGQHLYWNYREFNNSTLHCKCWLVYSLKRLFSGHINWEWLLSFCSVSVLFFGPEFSLILYFSWLRFYRMHVKGSHCMQKLKLDVARKDLNRRNEYWIYFQPMTFIMCYFPSHF